MADPASTPSAAHEFVGSLVGRPAHQRAVARDAVSASVIRAWCDAMGERNPIYLDGDAARAAGYADVVAPPAMLQVWTMPGLEPDRPYTAGPSRAGDLDEEVRATLTQLGYSGTLAATTDQEFLAPLVVGVRVVAEGEYIAASAEKQTQLGPGFFLTHRTTYSSEDGAVVGRFTASVFHFAPRSVTAVASPLPQPPAEPARPVAAGPLHLARDLRCGPVVVPVTPTQVIAGAAATRDFYPVHHDRDFARAHGNADFLMNILTTNGLIARIVAEWTSQAPLLRLTTRLVSPAYVHDELTVTGVVTELGPDGADITVTAALRSGVHAEAVARVQLENKREN